MSGKHACLIKIKTGDDVRSHIMMGPHFIIGRSVEVDLPISDVTISRQHARIDILGENILITDLNSNNGTFVDSVRLEAGAQANLAPYSIVQLGSGTSEMTFLPIPMPVEMLPPEEQKRVLLKAMGEVEVEQEQVRKTVLEEERKRVYTLIQQEGEEARHRLDAEIQTLRATAQLQLQKEAEEASQRKQQLLAQTREKFDQLNEESLRDFEAKKAVLEARLKSLETEAHSVAEKIHLAAKEKADALLKDAQLDIAQQMKAVTETVESRLKDVDNRCTEKIHTAEKEAADIVAKAKTTVAAMVQETDHRNRLLTEEAKKKAENVLNDARRRADLQVEELKRSALDSVRQTTFAEQEKIIKEYRASIETLKDTLMTLETKSSIQETALEKLEQEKATMSSEVTSLSKYIIDQRLHLTQINGDIEAVEKKIKAAQMADEQRAAAVRETNEAKAQLENLRVQLAQQFKIQDDELQAKKEKALLEFQEFRKRQDDELAQSRLKAIEKVKAKIEDEERRYNQTLRMRATEISSNLEKRLLPQIELDMRSKGVNASLASYLQTIRDAVEEIVVIEKSGLIAATDHLNPILPKDEGRTRNRRRWLMIPAALAVGLATYYSDIIFQKLKNFQSDHSYIDSLITKRAAESIYAPTQSTDWHETYTGNVLYYRNYLEAMQDSVFQDQWVLRLNNLEMLRSMKLNEDDIVQFIGKERALINQLGNLKESLDAKYLEQGLEKMNQAEAQAVQEMKQVLKTDENWTTVRQVERDFVTQFIKTRFEAERMRLPSQEHR
jgi:pSer/pThr/pTyr-binding forkhead associated (FHA) protein